MKKILVIEDEEFLRANIVKILQLEDFYVIEAENGLVGVQLAREQLPDLILCDVMMPELDGHGVLSGLDENPATAAIPFIFITAKASKADLRQGMDLGADDYLTKPFTADELVAAITTRLEKRATVIQQSEKALEGLRKSITEALPQELQEPLDEISGFLRTLGNNYNSIKPQEILETVKNINSSTRCLQRLIENIIMYAQIEVLATDPELVPVLSECYTLTPREIIIQASSQKAEQYQRETDLKLTVADTTVRIDKQDLQKAVEEIVDNAFKFSEAGTPVHVKATIDIDTFNLCITNYGRIMGPEQIASVGAFVQIGRRIYEQQGLGLGLIIAKRIAELHGGNLTIQSKPDLLQTSVCIRLRSLLNLGTNAIITYST